MKRSSLIWIIGGILVIGMSVFFLARKNTSTPKNPPTENATNTQTVSSAFDLHLTSYAFTHRPAGQPDSVWPDNSARILFPTRLEKAPAPSVHAFIYLPGTNPGDRLPEESYLAMLRSSLQRVAGTKNIVIMTPHHNQSGDTYPGFRLEDFYENAVRALHEVLPYAQITDVTIGGHDRATCGDHPVLLQAYDQSLSILRNIIAYDGCLGDDITPENTKNTSGISLSLAPDRFGMGKLDPTSVSGQETRLALVRRLWRFGSTPKPCPPCVSKIDTQAQCYGQIDSFRQPDGGSLLSIETSAGHDASVGVMTDIAFCGM